METLLRDARYALRSLLRTPGFTLTAVLSLALGLGATTAIFSVVDGLLLRPPPYPEPDQLAVIWSANPNRGLMRMPTSLPDFKDYREQASSFEAMAAYSYTDVNISGGESPERVRAIQVAGELTKVLRTPPALGRGFLPDEEVFGRNRVVVISHGLWKRRFGGNPDILGKLMIVDAREHTIVGVLPPGLDFPSANIQVWVPLAPEPGSRFESRRARFLEVLGRLKPGLTGERAQRELKTIAERVAQATPGSTPNSTMVLSLREQRAGNIRMGLLVTLGAVSFVLLIACANVANLLLARGARRQRELAIRAALGATRKRLVQQMLTESVLLAVLGGLVGLALAFWGVNAARVLVPAEINQAGGVGLNGRVMVFALLLSVATGLLFGTLPALSNSRLNLMDTLKESAPSSASPTGPRLRGLLVAAEVALALMLLVGGGLLLRSLQATLAVDPGFKPEGVLAVGIALPESKYQNAQQTSAFFQQLLERVSHLPGVENAGAISGLPMSGRVMKMPITVDGRAENATVRSEDLPIAELRVLEGNYFGTLGYRLHSGRLFGGEDGPGTVPVAVINESALKVLFSENEAVGQRLILGPPDHLLSAEARARLPDGKQPRLTVVGVVKDVRSQGLRNPVAPEIYTLQSQGSDASQSMVLAVRASSSLTSLMPMLRKTVTELDPDQAISEARRMQEYVDASLLQPKLLASFLGAFAAVALALAMIGVSGVVGYSVSQRMREFGIRLALGAPGGHIVGQVFRQGGVWVGLGVLVGIGGALSLTRVLQGLLFHVSALDPLTYAGVILGLGGTTLVALYIPARRALKVDPVSCLRVE